MPHKPKTNKADYSNPQYDKNRKGVAERGYDNQWRKFREWYLRQYPMCTHCEDQDRLTIAKELHHIKPLSQGGERLDENNVEGLCKSCHSRLSRRDG